jgi:hypothetical protein
MGFLLLSSLRTLRSHNSLLRARQLFSREGYLNPTDFEETQCRGTACEVIARRMLRQFPAHRLQNVMSTRFRYRESDGDASAPISALESAIDQSAKVRKDAYDLLKHADLPLVQRDAAGYQRALVGRVGAAQQ